MRIGYARVSTDDQNLDLQTDTLKAAGCEKIFSDIPKKWPCHRGVSGAKTERFGLDETLDQIRKGDILMIWKLKQRGMAALYFADALSMDAGIFRYGPLTHSEG